MLETVFACIRSRPLSLSPTNSNNFACKYASDDDCHGVWCGVRRGVEEGRDGAGQDMVGRGDGGKRDGRLRFVT